MMLLKSSNFIFVLICFLGLQACSKSLLVKNVDYSQRIESVLQPDSNGVVNDVRYGITYSIMPIQYEEFNDSSSVLISEVRMIRNNQGFYFITANKFKHVYVMEPKKGYLMLDKKILVKEDGLKYPALNARSTNIQLIEQAGNTNLILNQKGIKEVEEQS